ncbi:Putative flagellar basal body rod synthesis FlgD [Candidatus Trichorickettsia mobilis]|uniref:Flagellar basal body rod synthesis FlgD n=1 Tax=Candidatus Trichorickettsia mobilis TaxID=1346319 RepID=A0ABZ0UWE6_9RICK|nr:FlgD immunoglobulin-like domain containing protein [Candidatus Trichorickettsia mobilis]WPY01328.1 Putative flagellar basal body rod synthesis FlgD [Candidatus Trichorickettsia mobilis]
MKVLNPRQTGLAESLLAEKTFGGKRQANHSSAYNKLNQNDSFEAAMEQLEKVTRDFERTVMASFKHQNIIGMLSGDGSGGNNDSQQKGIMDLSKMTVDIAQNKTLINQMQRLVESNEQSQIDLYMGKEVYYDDTIRNYSGNDITFDYELKYGNFPQGTNISARISIFDANGRVVFNGKCNNNNGSNKFLWNGRDDKGQEVAEGKYRMEVSASATLAGSKATLPINVTSSLSGVVDGIRVSDGKRLLVVNDKLVDPDNITEYKNVKADNEAISVSASADLIGMQATIDLSVVRVVEGKGELIYDNQVQIEHPGDVRVDITDKNGKPLTTIIYNEPLLAGVGTLELDAKKHKLDDGEYNYTLYVKDNDSQQNIQLGKVKLVDVTGVDIKNKKIIAGSATYPLANITGIIGESREERFLTGLAASYIGTQVEYENSNFNHNSGDQFTREVRIQKPAEGQRLGDAVLKIYKGEQLVAEVLKPAGELYYQGQELTPRYDELDLAGQTMVNNYIKDKFLIQGFNQYTDLNLDRQIAVAPYVGPYINTEFRAGNIFKQGQAHDEATRLKNREIVEFHWDGRRIDGLLAENGEYRYEVHTTTVDNITNIITSTKVSTITNDLIKSSIVENGQLSFELASGRTITDKQILAIKS